MNHWAKKGVLDRVFAELQRLEIIRGKVEVLSLDSTLPRMIEAPWGSPCPEDRRGMGLRDVNC